MKNYESPAEALDDLRKRGYDADFEPQLNSLYCDDLDMRLNEEEFHIDEVYRFEGDSSPKDDAVVYALTSNTGVRGTIAYEFGASAGTPFFNQ
jgi:hypothetical protein